jgi:restriction modification system DNA specificity domain protein (fragment)
MLTPSFPQRCCKEIIGERCVISSYYEKVGDQRVCIDDDLPYSLPEGWVWCELQDCCIKEIKRGRSPKYADNGHVLSFAQKCNQKTGGINMGLALLIDDSTACRYEDDEYLQDGDIVINSTGTGTLGRVGIYRATDNLAGTPVVPDSHVTVVRVSSLLDPLYFFYCLKSMQSRLETLGEGSTNQKELKPLTVQQLRIPIPPIAE